jgi:hypothetical protein
MSTPLSQVPLSAVRDKPIVTRFLAGNLVQALGGVGLEDDYFNEKEFPPPRRRAPLEAHAAAQGYRCPEAWLRALSPQQLDRTGFVLLVSLLKKLTSAEQRQAAALFLRFTPRDVKFPSAAEDFEKFHPSLLTQEPLFRETPFGRNEMMPSFVSGALGHVSRSGHLYFFSLFHAFFWRPSEETRREILNPLYPNFFLILLMF